MNYAIDLMRPEDWDQVRTIYLEGIATGQATFETVAPDWESWDAGHLDVCRLVARQVRRAEETAWSSACGLPDSASVDCDASGPQAELHSLSPDSPALFAGERVLGWAALSAVSRRQVYSGVAEVSVYVASEARGRGIGDKLMAELVAGSERNGIWTLQSAVFPENRASIALHLKHGFRELGRRERVARLHGVWRDTVLLERRSRSVGVD